MTLPKITNKQQEIPKLLYQFRFLNRLQIQKFLHHKDKRRINSWLKYLTETEYIEKVPKESSFEERTKLTIYRTGINGIRFLKTLDNYSPEIIRNLYKDKNRSDDFINQSILLADIYIDLQGLKSNGVRFNLTTSSEFARPDSPFHFLIDLNPHLVFVKLRNKTKKYYLLEAFEPTLPRHSIRKRLRTYLKFFFSNTWENNTNAPFPIILFICPTKAFLIYAKRFAKKLLETEQNPENLHIRFATADEVQKFGVTGEIWEEA